MTALRFTVEHDGEQVEVVRADAFDFAVKNFQAVRQLYEATVELALAVINGPEEPR